MKILSNKKYNELILKSCKGMFGAVNDDMLLRVNALLNEENKQLKDNWNKLRKYIRETKIKEFEKSYGKRSGKTFTQSEIIICNMIIDKMQELEKGDK